MIHCRIVFNCKQQYHFNCTAISKEEADDVTNRSQLPFNGYSEEFLDRLEPNGNIPTDKDHRYGRYGSFDSINFYIIHEKHVQFLKCSLKIMEKT